MSDRDKLLLDLKVDEITFHLNQLLEHGFAVGVDPDENRFIVVCKHTADPTHYVTYDEDEDRFEWSRSD